MRLTRHLMLLAFVATFSLSASNARAQIDDEDIEEELPSAKADPAAMKAFTEMVQAYRALPAITIKSKVQVEMMEGDLKSRGHEVSGEFILAPGKKGVIKLRDFTVYLKDGQFTAVHAKTDNAYFTIPDDGAPYYALLTSFVDMPFPELAIFLGEESMDDLLMQFHPRAFNAVPSSVTSEEKDGKKIERLKLTAENERIDIDLDPESKLIQSMEVHIGGGDMVQEGFALVYRHSYEYEIHDQPLDDSAFTFDPGTREKVDMMAALIPAPEPAAPGGGGGALVGQPAPPFVLATADGKAMDLNDLKGRVVVLDFWATWCGPCMAALPKLHEVAKWVADEQKPVSVLTINVWEIRDPNADNPDARLDSAKQTWTKKNFTLPILMDYTDEIGRIYGVTGIPTTVIIRSDGVVHAQHTGAMDVDALKTEIEAALKAVEPGM